MASSSSMKDDARGLSLRLLEQVPDRAAPTPTNISTKSLPLSEKKGTWASPATARESSVFPVPGSPTSSTPWESLAQGDVAVRVLEEVDHLLEFVLRLVAAGDVGEGDARVAVGHQPGTALAETHHRLSGGFQPSG